MVQLNLLEHYEEVIERQPSEISYFWKGALMLAYFVSSLSSYACAILFYTLWYEASGGHCFFWGEVRWMPVGTIEHENSTNYDWTQDILITHQFTSYCNWFHFSCLLSCFAAISFLMMVTICGKGDETSLFVEPWRLIMPALGTSLFMMIMTMVAAYNFSHGYFHLIDSLYRMAYQITRNRNTTFNYNRSCEVFQRYLATHNIDRFDICAIDLMIQASSWMMTWGWIGGFCVLLLRLLTFADFHLAKISIYEVPAAGPERDAVVRKLQERKISVISHKKEAGLNNFIERLKES